MKRIQRIPVIVATTMLVLTWGSGALAQVVGLDWKIQHVTTTPSGTPNNPITEGAQVKVRCEWTATIAKTGNMPQPIEWTGFLLVDGKMIKKITAKYSAKSGWFYQPGQYGTATNEFDGSGEGIWSAGGVGNHTIRCEIAKVGNALESMTKATDNQKEIVVPVIALKPVTPGTWPTPTPKAGANQPPGNQQAIPGGPPLPPKR